LQRIFFSRYHKDLKPGDHGVICSFGAGYSIGSLVVRKRKLLDHGLQLSVHGEKSAGRG